MEAGRQRFVDGSMRMNTLAVQGKLTGGIGELIWMSLLFGRDRITNTYSRAGRCDYMFRVLRADV